MSCTNYTGGACAISPQLIKDIAEYIVDEFGDSRYYTLLAAKAPTARSRDLLVEFAAEEYKHAQNFMQAYYALTGRMFTLPAMTDPTIPDYQEALKVRIIAETNDYRKYGEKYQQVAIPWLRKMFWDARTGEDIHAMRIPILMEEAQLPYTKASTS